MLNIAGIILLLLAGLYFGRRAEKRHYKSIISREHKLNALPAIASRYPPTDNPYHHHLVTGSTVVSSDYFKTFTAGLINLFGGQVTSFESLVDRARREAILRMKAQANAAGAEFVFNIKLETSQIAAGGQGAVEVIAYGTALIPAHQNIHVA